jgi:hypothetical protein
MSKDVMTITIGRVTFPLHRLVNIDYHEWQGHARILFMFDVKLDEDLYTIGCHVGHPDWEAAMAFYDWYKRQGKVF